MYAVLITVIFAIGLVNADVPCASGQSCPDGSTCCKLTSGQYGCCPYPSATCCSDGLHCCPSGYTCDLVHSQCVAGELGTALPWALTMERGLNQPIRMKKRQPALKGVTLVKCPDGNYCQDGTTCCKLASGQYGCCPYPAAVCCSDGSHCCPSGYTCDVPHQRCVAGSAEDLLSFSARKLEPTSVTKVNQVPCQGGGYCPDGNTCCKLASGQEGCCPYPNADCCSDGLHCCPQGYTCDVAHSQCVASHKFPLKQLHSRF